jgi:hypothetical protein
MLIAYIYIYKAQVSLPVFHFYAKNRLESESQHTQMCFTRVTHNHNLHAQRQVVLESQLQLPQILLESQPNLRTQIAYSNHNQNTDTLRWQGVRVSSLGQFKGQGKLRCDVTIIAPEYLFKQQPSNLWDEVRM